MYVAKRCPPLYYFREPGEPSESQLADFRPSVIEALEAMGVWLPEGLC